jgi:hypothetical protein
MGSIAKVRRLVGDTDSTDYRLLDADITAILADNNGDDYKAAAEAARSIAAQLAMQEDIKISETTLSGNSAYLNMIKLAESLEKQAARSFAIPYAGGISKADKLARESNTDRVQPAFTRALHTVPGATTDEVE